MQENCYFLTTQRARDVSRTSEETSGSRRRRYVWHQTSHRRLTRRLGRDVRSQTSNETSRERSLFRMSGHGMYLGRLFYVAHQTLMRRPGPDVRADVSVDVCISDVWARDVFGKSVLGPGPGVLITLAQSVILT